MKQFLHSYRLFLIVAALCTLSAFWLLGARIGVEQTQRQVDVVVSYEDVCALSDASGIPVQDWLTQLADAGARELLVTPAELADPDIMRAAQDAGLGTAQAGGLAQGGTYFFAARYDTLAAAGQTGVDTDTEPLAQAQVLDALRESGSTLVLIEDRNQTGCVLPDGYTLDGYTGSMVKGFWLNQTFRARYQTLGYSGAEEIVNMLYRAVVDRGMTVLWLTPLTDAAGETVAQPEVYTQLLQDLAQRIAPAGYQYGSITGIPAKTVSPVLLMLCGIGVFAAAIVLLGVFVSLRARWLRALLFALGCAESVGGALLAPALQSTALALLAAIVFPCLAVAVLAAMLRESVQTRPGIGRYIGTTALGTAITFWGCCYIGAILSGSEYLLVLRLFRGVKLSQLAVYAVAMVLLAMALLHTRGCSVRDDLRTLRQENSRHWRKAAVPAGDPRRRRHGLHPAHRRRDAVRLRRRAARAQLAGACTAVPAAHKGISHRLPRHRRGLLLRRAPQPPDCVAVRRFRRDRICLRRQHLLPHSRALSRFAAAHRHRPRARARARHTDPADPARLLAGSFRRHPNKGVTHS